MLVAKSCPTLCNPRDCSLPVFSVHGILQARILEWVAIPFSRGSSWHRNWTCVSCIAGRFFTVRVTREALGYLYQIIKTRLVQKLLDGMILIVTTAPPPTCGLQHARLSYPLPTTQSSFWLMSVESVMPKNHLIFCRPLLLQPSIFPSIRVF